jgi:lysyl endopeptidase
LVLGLASVAAPAAEAVRAEPQIQPELPAGPEAVPRADLALAAKVRLPAAKAREVQGTAGGASGVPLQVGYPRSVAALASARDVSAQLAWQPLVGGGRVAALSVTSPGAGAVRLGLRVESLPWSASLRFYAPAGDAVFAASGAEVRALLERNAAAGDTSDEARTYWTPAVEGDTLVVEVELAAGIAADEVRLSAPTLSHIAGSPRDGFGFAKAAASCELDATCYQDTWSNESSAVSRIIFTSGGTTFVCTGTLLADRDTSTNIPYFLTANHCVSTQTIASTVQNYWFYRSTACNSGVRGSFLTTFGGGTLLYATPTTDTAFMRLNSPPPAGTTYAGWIANEPTLGTAVTGIHHPTGDLQKISFGNVVSFWNCASSGDGQFDCNGTSPPSATFFGINWRSGITEGGSSGSGIFVDGGKYLVGQLYGGDGKGSCTGTPFIDFYGRFDVAYNGALYQWLGLTSAGSGATPAYNVSDLWWNPNESGWGLSVTQHGASLFGAWFVYDGSGHASWFVIPGGRWTTSTTFTGDVWKTTGPDPMAANFDPTRVARTQVGTATLRFDSASSASFSYTVNGVSETRAIERQAFGAGPAVTDGFGDLWWNASESGWGVSVHQQGQSLFVVWYSYAPDGSSTWFVIPGGAWTSGDTFSGTIYRTSGAGFFGRAFDASAVARTAAGNFSLRFVDANNAVMSYTIDGIFGTKPLTRQPF